MKRKTGRERPFGARGGGQRIEEEALPLTAAPPPLPPPSEQEVNAPCSSHGLRYPPAPSRVLIRRSSARPLPPPSHLPLCQCT